MYFNMYATLEVRDVSFDASEQQEVLDEMTAKSDWDYDLADMEDERLREAIIAERNWGDGMRRCRCGYPKWVGPEHECDCS